MKEVQENLKKIEVEGIAGGNLVKVILKGDYEMKSILINPIPSSTCYPFTDTGPE